MTVRYLADTDWVIHYLSGHRGIIEKLKSLREEGLGVSVMGLRPPAPELMKDPGFSRFARKTESTDTRLRGFPSRL